MKSLLLLSSVVCFAILANLTQASAQEKYETIVEGTRFNSTSKVILDEKAIQESKAPNISDLLLTQANISIVSSPVQSNSIFLRGGDSSHILILVDGLPFYDPTTIQKTFNLNDIDIRKVKKIEIVKGSQSVLYGGQALTGVIKIETFPTEIENKRYATLEGGQRNYKKGSLEAIQVLSETQAAVARVEANEKANRSPVLGSDINYKSQLASGDLGYLYRSDFDLFFKASQIWDRGEFAMPSAQGVEDAEDNLAISSVVSAMAGLRLKQSSWKPQLWVGHQNAHRIYNQPDYTDYIGDLTTARAELIPVDLEKTHLVLGLSYTREKYREKHNAIEQANATSEDGGVFAKLTQTLSEDFELELGARRDDIYHKEQVDTYQVGLSFFKNYRFEYATGFKVPSLFQQYSTTYGQRNPDLKSEKAQTFSLTYDRALGEKQNISATVFETSFSNLIQYQGLPPTGQYVNVARAVTRGVEAQYTYKTEDHIRADLNLGYQEPWDVQRARWLSRRPLQSGSLRLAKTWTSDEIGYELIGNGERLDTIGSLRSFLISNLFYSHQFTNRYSAYIRGNNVFDSRYEQTYGYHDEGAFWFAGLDISL